MMRPRISNFFTACAATVLAVACARPGMIGSTTQTVPAAAIAAPDTAAIARARADSARYPYTAADIEFVSAMILHHSQAIVMAEWTATHDASAPVRTLADRIINAQQDEILTMQTWLRDRRQPLPAPGRHTMKMAMGGVEHEMPMPGMLSDDQLHRLDKARGPAFDRLFLVFMIQHHSGAITMVNALLGTQGAMQDQTIFKLASDISADQSSEVARMQQMLKSLPPT